jgi:lysophospholipase L1-like esterase
VLYCLFSLPYVTTKLTSEASHQTFVMLLKLTVCLSFCVITVVGIGQNKIAVIGSSTAYGTGLMNPAEESWVNLTKSYYINQGTLTVSNNILNLAVAGTNCITGMPTGYVSTYLNPDFNAPDPNKNITAAITSTPKPSVVIVNYPTNGYDWLPISEIMSDLRRIKQYADSARVRCFITTTQPRNSFSTSERAKLKELRDSIIEGFGYFAIDFWMPLALPDNSQNPLYAADDVHPNAAGHQLLFNKVIAKDIFGFISAAPLPVQDFNFSIKTTSTKSQLSWTSPIPIDATTYFNVEKSKDGRSFTSIATIKNSGSSVLSYTDNNIADSGKVFYRIAQVNGAGLIHYSKIITVEIKNNGFDVTGFDPQLKGTNFSFYVYVRRISGIRVSLYSSSGAFICEGYKQLSLGANKIDLLVPLSAGVYYLIISNENMNVTKKIIRF